MQHSCCFSIRLSPYFSSPPRAGYIDKVGDDGGLGRYVLILYTLNTRCDIIHTENLELTSIFPSDRVFVHALNTVKKIPKTGASRPPPSDRLRLYGLYKQAMEGDVDGVMERPLSYREGEDGRGSGPEGDELKRERDKWDAWDAQRGVGRTEAKRRYIEALIETMHKYASTTA